MMAGETRDEDDLVAVQLLQVRRFTQRAADVQQIRRCLVDQLVRTHIVVRKLQHLRRQPIVARIGNAAQVAQRFQRVDQALRGAAVQARLTRDVGQGHVPFRPVEGVQHLKCFFSGADKQRRPGCGGRLRFLRVVDVFFAHGEQPIEF
ncbi:hypothetical protein D3C72_1586230 [compost metagenome]